MRVPLLLSLLFTFGLVPATTRAQEVMTPEEVTAALRALRSCPRMARRAQEARCEERRAEERGALAERVLVVEGYAVPGDFDPNLGEVRLKIFGVSRGAEGLLLTTAELAEPALDALWEDRFAAPPVVGLGRVPFDDLESAREWARRAVTPGARPLVRIQLLVRVRRLYAPNGALVEPLAWVVPSRYDAAFAYGTIDATPATFRSLEAYVARAPRESPAIVDRLTRVRRAARDQAAARASRRTQVRPAMGRTAVPPSPGPNRFRSVAPPRAVGMREPADYRTLDAPAHEVQ